MAVTKTFIVSLALGLMGHKPIISLDNADAMTLAASNAFDLLLPAILSANNWRFAVAIQPLVQSLEIPPAPWGAIYNLPSGYLKLIRLWPNIWQFEIYNGNKLYTVLRNSFFTFSNCSCEPPSIPPPPQFVCPCSGYQPFSIEYVYQVPPEQLPPHFYNYFIYEIALYLGLSNAQRPDYYSVLERQRNYQFAMAAAIEAQNRPQFSQVNFPVLLNRNIGGFIGNGGNSGGF